MKILIVILFISFVSGEKVIRKCCPFDELVDVYEGNYLSADNLFSCVQNSSQNNSIPIFTGYNTLVDQESHWPPCDGSLSIEPLSKSKLHRVNPTASCFDIMDGKYSIFTCKENMDMSKNAIVEVMRLKKCCAAGMSYDIFQRMCVEINETSDFHELFNDKVVLLEHEILKCQTNEALVEYHSLVHGFKMRGNALVLTKSREAGPEVIQNSFCIETTMNSDVEIPLGMSEDHFDKRSRSKFIAKTCRNKKVCENMPCIQKCCPHSQRLARNGNKTECVLYHADVDMKFHHFNKSQSNPEPPAIEPFEYGLLSHEGCEKYVLDEEEDGVYFHSGIDGSLFLAETTSFYTNQEYCVDFFAYPFATDPIEMKTFVCFSDDFQQNAHFHIYATLLAISAFFLGLTFLVYIFLPKLLNLHGKTVVCHVISLLLGYTFLSIVQFATEVRLSLCLLIAFIVYFGLLSAFSWLNVMCLDIYWTFGSVRTHHGIRRTKEMKRFMYYSLYAWGFPFVLTIFTFMIDFYKLLPRNLRPNIGDSKCWFEKQSSPGHLIFFLLPIGIQISVNFVLFVLTAVHCNRIKAEIHRMQASDNSDQQKKKSFIADKAIFIMNIKLFSVMGISWLLEIIATLYNQDSMWWYISDVFNCLQGVLVFFVFVFKRKVLVAFQKKLGIRKMGLRPKTPTTLSTLDLNSTSVSRNGRMMTKSSSAATLNTTLIKN